MTSTWNTDLLESVGENVDVNFVMKEFPGDKQFIIWWISLEQCNIRMRSAASGDPVPMKRRAVNTSSLLKKHSVVLQYYVCEISKLVMPFSIANIMLFVWPAAHNDSDLKTIKVMSLCSRIWKIWNISNKNYIWNCRANFLHKQAMVTSWGRCKLLHRVRYVSKKILQTDTIWRVNRTLYGDVCEWIYLAFYNFIYKLLLSSIAKLTRHIRQHY
jgi:hypothetical protein